MNPSLSLLLLLGPSQAYPPLEEGSGAEVHNNITTRILTSNNGSSEILLEGDMVVPKTRNAMLCWTHRGGQTGPLSLNRLGCLYHGITQHEINHALGFHHEQTRSDHDQYVRINWENIDPRMAYNFYRQYTNNLDTPYDYSSIMHYGRTAFSIQYGKDSITPIPDPTVQIGQRQGMSRLDILRINRHYGC